MPTVRDPSGECDVVIVGGGILGLAVAREVLQRDPGLRLVVLEREDRIGSHQTSRNSGVVHAGIYYQPGSLKARLCVEGARALYEHCERKGIAVDRCGKLIVALDEAELGRLDELEQRGLRNDVPGLRRLRGEEIAEFEPHARGVAALHSPHTGIVDFGAVARSFAEDVESAGGVIATEAAVTAVSAGGRRLSIVHARGGLRTRHAIFCAGLWSDRLAVAAGAAPDPRIVPFRGGYMTVRPQRRSLVRALIYPVPDPALPFLGVHLTRTSGGEVLVGPTALLAPGRTAYRLSQVSARDLAQTIAWPGTWRMALRWWRTGLRELRYTALPASLARAAAQYVPELHPTDLGPGPAGIRAQALARDGTLVDDFAFSETTNALHVRNAPSPAATSSLAIAAHIVDRAAERFGIGRR